MKEDALGLGEHVLAVAKCRRDLDPAPPLCSDARRDPQRAVDRSRAAVTGSRSGRSRSGIGARLQGGRRPRRARPRRCRRARFRARPGDGSPNVTCASYVSAPSTSGRAPCAGRARCRRSRSRRGRDGVGCVVWSGRERKHDVADVEAHARGHANPVADVILQAADVGLAHHVPDPRPLLRPPERVLDEESAAAGWRP